MIVRYADVPATPWANGAGETRELWSDAGEGNGFERRISVATLSRAVSFSRLPGISRTFMPIDDIRLSLLIDGQTAEASRFQFLRFEGRSVVSLMAIDRPGRVLNVMSRASVWDHAVSLVGALHTGDAALLLQNGRLEDRDVSVGDLLLNPDPSALPLFSATICFSRVR